MFSYKIDILVELLRQKSHILQEISHYFIVSCHVCKPIPFLLVYVKHCKTLFQEFVKV